MSYTPPVIPEVTAFKTTTNLGGTTMNDSGGISDVDTSVTLTDSTSFPASGTIAIGSEEMTYTGNAANVLSGLVRGANDTTAASHADGVQVGEVFDSGQLDEDGKTQVQTEIFASHDGQINITFNSDSGGTDVVRPLSIPYTSVDGFQFFAAPAFVNWVRYRFTNLATTPQTDFYYTTKLLTTSLSPQLLTTNAFIAAAMVTQLGRNIIVGVDGETGGFKNVSTTTTTNDHGDHINLNVVSGARPSELAGRVKVAEVVDTLTSVLQRTITASKTFYVTDIVLTIDNTDNTNTGEVRLRDGLTVAGSIVFPMLVAESPNNESVVTTITHTFLEPIEFSTGLFIEEGVGVNHVTGIIIGYEE